MRISNILFLAVILCLFSLIVVPPYLAGLGYGLPLDFSFRVFERYCHQLPERTLTVSGHKMPVCARCFGIYLGMLIGALTFPYASKGKAPPGWVLIALAVPMALDGVSQLVGLRTSTNGLRVVTGFLFGFAIPFYLVPVIDDILAPCGTWLERFYTPPRITLHKSRKRRG